jgi:hypothetical protein
MAWRRLQDLDTRQTDALRALFAMNISPHPEEFGSLSEHQKELDRHFAWFESKLPPRPAKFVGWVRKPSSIYARVPIAILLVAGGFLSFLPVLGLWMLPLGLLLFAQDVPPLQKPMAHGLGWVERKWLERERAKRERERVKGTQ